MPPVRARAHRAMPTLLWLLLLAAPRALAQTACTAVMPYANQQFLTAAQLGQYMLSDPCSITCAPGFSGDFCTPMPVPALIPRGPWNVPGYYTVGVGVLKPMALALTTQYSGASFTGSDNTLVSLFNQGQSTSSLRLISLSSQQVTQILSPPSGGSLDAVQVRYGQVFVARSTSPAGPFDISIVIGPLANGQYSTQPYLTIPLRATTIEIFQDKGMNTTFVHSTAPATSNQVWVCYPSRTCVKWYTFPISDGVVTGMVCGVDCPKAVYVSHQYKVYRVALNSAVMLVTSPTLVTCMASVPGISTILYRTSTSVQQLTINKDSASGNENYGAVMLLAAATASCQGVCCSVDVSDSNSLIMLVEGGLVYTSEALQRPCAYGSTSPGVTASSSDACVPCPAAPLHGFLTAGSRVCEWQCESGYTRAGAKCVGLPPPPCPRYYALRDGACLPSAMPWASDGNYVSGLSVKYALPTTAPMFSIVGRRRLGIVGAQPVLTFGSDLFFLAQDMAISAGKALASAWIGLAPQLPASPTNPCGAVSDGWIYYLMQQSGLLFVGFDIPGSASVRHCMWALDTTQIASAPGTALTLNVAVTGYWTLAASVCSVATDGSGGVYLLQCGANSISMTSSASPGTLTPVAGHARQGYADGQALAALFRSPSSVVFYAQRLYVADTGNCVLREVDLVRQMVSTVAGVAGACEQQDGATPALSYPSNLTLTPYPGFFLFLDQAKSLTETTVRQFHADTGYVSTIGLGGISAAKSVALVQTLAFGAVYLGSEVRVQSKSSSYTVGASVLPCPAGTTALEGNALSAEGCTPCGPQQYSPDRIACVPCTTAVCAATGTRPVACGGASDASCGPCTNKPDNPSEPTVYTGPAVASDSFAACPWVYTPPCPAGFYASGTVCVACPPWATTAQAGAGSVQQCVCRSGALQATVPPTCLVPSPYDPSLAGSCPAFSECPAYTPPAFPFPLDPACTSPALDSYLGVCACQPGQYVSQIYPKLCVQCPPHLYSPDGRACLRCPPYAKPSADGTACLCTGGLEDAAPSAAAPVCVCGAGRAFSAARGCTPCQANTYTLATLTVGATPWLQSQVCPPCAAGQTSTAGQSSCTPCAYGQFRAPGMGDCADCGRGWYATDPGSGLSCTACTASCGGRRQTPCPTDASLYVCADCGAPRPHASFNGVDNCATACWDGYYELDGECVACSAFNASSCPAGMALTPCGAYYDAECLQCASDTKPDYHSEWVYDGGGDPAGPSRRCEWRCADGYTARRVTEAVVGGPAALWVCMADAAWSMLDLFTV